MIFLLKNCAQDLMTLLIYHHPEERKQTRIPKRHKGVSGLFSKPLAANCFGCQLSGIQCPGIQCQLMDARMLATSCWSQMSGKDRMKNTNGCVSPLYHLQRKLNLTHVALHDTNQIFSIQGSNWTKNGVRHHCAWGQRCESQCAAAATFQFNIRRLQGQDADHSFLPRL